MKKLRLTAKSLELIHQGVTANRFFMDLMNTLTAEERETVHTALGYLAQASRPIYFSQKRKEEQHAPNA